MFMIRDSRNIIVVYLYSFLHGQMLSQSFKAESWWLVLDSFGCWLLGKDVILGLLVVLAVGCG